MKPHRWKKIETICFEAMDLQGEELDTYLMNACADDNELLTEVKSLLNQAETESILQPFVEIQSSSVFSKEHVLSEKLIGPYRLIREIASGGMGQVYLAVRNDDQFERFVALKVIRKELVDENILARFYEERQILASLNHPNIARLFDGGTTEAGIPWFAMEYVEGELITDYCQQQHISLKKKISLYLKVCSAVQSAHQNLVVHRDLKPENILITRDGDPKLLDFGIAKLMSFEQKFGYTQHQNQMMTPEYASPEQVKQEAVSTTSDVYALGVLLYKLLTGVLPYDFKKRTPAAIEQTICNTIPSLPSVRSGQKILKGDLDCVIMKALKKNPSERYASVEQLANDLIRYEQALPVLAQKDSFTYQARKFIYRNKWSVAVSTAIIFLVVAFAAVTFMQSKAIKQRALEAEQQRDRAEQVSSFLTNLFESVDPSEAKDNALSAIELLHRGTERVETELSGQPQQQANLYLVISEVYEKLGFFDEGLSLAQKAYALQNELYAAPHPEIAQSLNAMGWLHRQKGDYEQADSLLSAGLTMRRELYGSNHLDVARSLNDLAVLKQSRGDYAATDSLLSESITIRKALAGEKHQSVGTALSNYAALKYGLGDFESAEEEMQEALDIFQQTVGDDDMRTANVMSNLAAILMVQQKMDGAINYYQKALDIRLKLLGEEHPDITSSYAHLGNLYRGIGKYDEAEELLLKALVLRKKLFGEDHEQVFYSKRILGILYDTKGDLVQAEKYYSEAVEGFNLFTPQGHTEMAETLHNLGALYLKIKNPDKAEPHLREALNMRQKILGSAHVLTIDSMINLGVCLAKNGNTSESRSLLTSGLEMLDEAVDGSQVLRNLAESTLAEL